MSPVIDIKGLSVSYDRKRVLSNIYLEIGAGSTYGVIGPNGAGKSTLFKAILGIIPVNAGEIRVFNGPIDEVRKKLAYVPQRDEVDWTFPATVMDVALMGRYPHKKILQRLNAADKEIALSALDELGIADLRGRQVGELSGGQQQRVFLARAICQEAEIFFLDEPFVGVDIPTERKIIEILQKLADEKKTVLVIHHDLASVDEYFDQVVLINQRLIAYGPTKRGFCKRKH